MEEYGYNITWLNNDPPSIRVPIAVDMDDMMGLMCGVLNGGMVGAMDDKIVTVMDEWNEEDMLHVMKRFWAEDWSRDHHYFQKEATAA